MIEEEKGLVQFQEGEPIIGDPMAYFYSIEDLGVHTVYDAVEEGLLTPDALPMKVRHHGKIDCYLSKSAFQAMLKHASQNPTIEVMGLLVGPKAIVFGKTGCVIYDAIGASLEASTADEASVRFRDEAF